MKSLIFDLDGTLINSAGSIKKALLESCKINNIVPRTPICDIKIGPPLDYIIHDIVPKKDVSRCADLRNTFMELYDDEFYKESFLYPGVTSALSQAAIQSDLFLITNKRISPTIKILHHLNILKIFKCILGCDSITASGLSKAKTISHLIHSFKLCRSDCAYLGDTETDMKACEEAGIDFIYASWGYGEIKQATDLSYLAITSWNDLYCAVREIDSKK